MSARVDPILALLLSPFVASMILLAGFAIYVAARADRNRRDRRAERIRAARVEATARSLAYLLDPAAVEHVRRVVAAETARLRAGESA